MKNLSSNNQNFNLPVKSLLVVVSGPSGVGKDVVLAKMKESNRTMEFIVTVTTRSQRAKEKDNVDYHFISMTRFQKMIQQEELLEWASVYGNMYGVPKHPIKQALEGGRDTIVKVDIQGAATIKKLLPQAVLVFLMPSSIPELAMRLKQRHTESAFDLTLRMKTAEEEIKKVSHFDYMVINKQDKCDWAVSQIEAIVTAEKCRVVPHEFVL